MKLTVKQEKFCKEYILTGNASEAYRIAYPTSLKWKPEVVHVRACELLKNSKVKVRVRELQDEQKKEFMLTLQDKKIIILKIIKANTEPNDYKRTKTKQLIKGEDGKTTEIEVIRDPKLATDGLKVLNLMDGHNAPEKRELTGADGGPIKQEQNLSEEDTLKVVEMVMAKNAKNKK